MQPFPSTSGSCKPSGDARLPARPNEPLRTCVGCGERTRQRELARFRVWEGQVVLDPKRSGGRGAWLHPVPECLERAIKRRAFGRAFRASDARTDPRVLLDLLTGNTRKD